MDGNGKKSTVEQQRDTQWINFSYAVGALSIDIVENIIVLRPHVMNQPGKTAFLHSGPYLWLLTICKPSCYKACFTQNVKSKLLDNGLTSTSIIDHPWHHFLSAFCRHC